KQMFAATNLDARRVAAVTRCARSRARDTAAYAPKSNRDRRRYIRRIVERHQVLSSAPRCVLRDMVATLANYRPVCWIGSAKSHRAKISLTAQWLRSRAWRGLFGFQGVRAVPVVGRWVGLEGPNALGIHLVEGCKALLGVGGPGLFDDFQGGCPVPASIVREHLDVQFAPSLEPPRIDH